MNKGGVAAPVAEAVGAVDKAVAEAPASTPPAPAEAPAAPAAQTGGKTKKSGGKKRKLNGYMKFANTRRPTLMKQNPGIQIAEIGKLLGLEWQKMGEDAKKAFA